MERSDIVGLVSGVKSIVDEQLFVLEATPDIFKIKAVALLRDELLRVRRIASDIHTTLETQH